MNVVIVVAVARVSADVVLRERRGQRLYNG